MAQRSKRLNRERSLPLRSSSFVGREHELADVIRLLSEESCRLLTLSGPGGIGKTRLALEAAGRLQQQFDHGVYFVALEAVESAALLPVAIADAMAVALSSGDDPRTSLLNYLHGKGLLLVLDNMEQLLDDAALLTAILGAAPQAKLLVTSREVLRLQEEWQYPLEGLPYPCDPGEQDLAPYSAVQLFVQRALRVRPNFSLAGEAEAVARICRTLKGMPLAIELAASWTKMLSCSAIADEVDRSLTFLTARMRDIPERHRSIQAVFNRSWQLLADGERSTFARLAVFRRGFSREAAEAVTGASLAILSSLVDKSLLRWETEGRYQIHELLRQYAEEQLQRDPQSHRQACDRHCAYYADFLSRYLDMLTMGGRQREAIAALVRELENIRRAWDWAVEQAKAHELYRAATPLSTFFQFQSRYLEAVHAFEHAARSLAGQPHTRRFDLPRASILVALGWFYIRLGRLGEAEAALVEASSVYRRLNIPPMPGMATDPLLPLSIVAMVKGDYQRAQQRAEQALQLSEANDHPSNREVACYSLAQALLAQGREAEARRYAEQAYHLARTIEDHWFMSYCLNTLGRLAHARDDLDAARGYYEASYALREEFDDPEGMAVVLCYLGGLALQQRAYAEAGQLYHRSVAIYGRINDRGGLATALSGLAHAALLEGHYPLAYQRYASALRMAAEMRYAPLLLSLLLQIGQLLIESGRPERGVPLLDLALWHPAADRQTQASASAWLARYKARAATAPPAAGSAADQQRDLQAIVAALERELAELALGSHDLPAVAGREDRTAGELLAEPLTERELQVLRLIADGLSNPEIAAELKIAVGTVKRYTAEIYAKLAVHSRTQAVARGRALQLLR